jgi:hypothetical protein
LVQKERKEKIERDEIGKKKFMKGAASGEKFWRAKQREKIKLKVSGTDAIKYSR